MFNPLIATFTIAIGALAALGAIIWQVAHGHEADAQLAGLVGLLFGAFLRMPGHADTVRIDQPDSDPVPVTGDGGYGGVETVVVVLVIVLLVLVILRIA